MDRLICGDVGFGKTEVALRAIFCVVSAGKQAMVLAPTIVLAKQHFDVVSERFSKYPDIKVGLLSRFQVCNYVCWISLFFLEINHILTPLFYSPNWTPLPIQFMSGFLCSFCNLTIFHKLQSKAEKEEHLDMIKHGHLNIIVGTHSLLGSRVVYNNLGLLVVDEEQVCLQPSSFAVVRDRGNLVNDRGKLHLNTAVVWSFLDILSCTEVAF